MNAPKATYRIQLSSAFTFKDLKGIIGYLHLLGVSTIYASPFFEARAGSTHGYDITNAQRINPEIGTLEELRELHLQLAALNMNWLQDIVPNHMAFDSNNPWIYDILENGPHSDFVNFFDINWSSENGDGGGKVMTPFLGDELEEVLVKGELSLNYDEKTFWCSYFDNKYPAAHHSYPYVLSLCLSFLKRRYSVDNDAYQELERVKASFENGNNDWHENKDELFRVYQNNETIRGAFTYTLENINTSTELLHELLSQQHFKLTHWKTTEKTINYRRFFTINDLICLRMEDNEVFQVYHQFIKQLCDEDLLQGLRIDHIDGLFDPQDYLEKLRALVGEDMYIIIEKILEWDEKLPLSWPIQDTSGYNFLALVNHLFTEPSGKAKFSEAYRSICPQLPDYDALVYEKKIFILKERMAGELDNLYQVLEKLGLLPDDKKGDKNRWLDALGSFMAALPVYRIYPHLFPLTDRQKNLMLATHDQARRRLAGHDMEFGHLLTIFLGEADKDPEKMNFFLQKCQQFTGPLAAKGVEDTAFYIFNRLISHNEVGDSPHVFGIPTQEFHYKMIQRKENSPLSINATATHDTKRGEDARMRINVLSEIPEEWFKKVDEWKKLNAQFQGSGPDDNEEYFIYQTLVGALPQEDNEEILLQRTQEYLQKVLREAKVHTTWSTPDEEYEQEVLSFIKSILKNDEFRRSFSDLSKKTSFFGAIYSLGQCLIKTTAPGIPDIYQGTELWDLSYVDPDNRRPVDYTQRADLLKEIKTERGNKDYIQQLLDQYENGHIKIFVLTKCLQERLAYPEVFLQGEYISLITTGQYKDRIISYIRKFENHWYLMVSPISIASICRENQWPLGKEVWRDTAIELPGDAPVQWTNLFNQENIDAAFNQLPISEVLESFPIALLKVTAL